MNRNIRTDLAVEAHEIWREEAGETTLLSGVEAKDEVIDGFKVTTVRILDESGEKALQKPRGSYITLELDSLLHREENSFENACKLLSDKLRELLRLEDTSSVLVVGLGNRDITPDAIGPETVDCVMVTRHLKDQMPETFAPFRRVSAMCSGVLGTTGMESGDIIKAVCSVSFPSAVVAVDALASRDTGKLCRTVQIADSGIVPGSGVGNARQALSRDTLGVPVIAIGVPTVVDAGTLASQLARSSGVELEPGALDGGADMFVTPRNIDKNVKDISKLIGYSLNLALHPGLSIEDVDMFLS